MAKEEIIAKARAKALKKASAYQRLFKSPDGKVVLKDLEEEFERELHVPGDPYGTHIRVGQYDVIKYIRIVMGVNTDA